MQKRRKQLRLRDFDYSSIGAYFIAIATEGHKCFLGQISEEKMRLSRIGKKAEEFWRKIPLHFSTIELDEFVIMPNHIHGILIIKEKTSVSKDAGVQLNAPTKQRFSRISPKKNTISVVVRIFKGMVTSWCRKQGIDYFAWQRSYYDHVIRNASELGRIREYVDDNVIKWSRDRENPESRLYMQDHDIYWQGVYRA